MLIVDRHDRLAAGVVIAKRARAIARQSVIAGMSLSILAMVVAAFGYIPPVAGAFHRSPPYVKTTRSPWMSGNRSSFVCAAAG